ncbi:hypothetical protein SCP_0805530 [Sparassis crispa]|uniref:Uncharacterized protein n=1 Tax=Sparassis crispa TaxID=139825 RepID=A0A401GV17_9APHY|nr:hypothetical protein SCP_0805530 [Sparassis crispa]GBE86029.1 hypothetical protein SCP_0805530 [Sparassis crispa]
MPWAESSVDRAWVPSRLFSRAVRGRPFRPRPPFAARSFAAAHGRVRRGVYGRLGPRSRLVWGRKRRCLVTQLFPAGSLENERARLPDFAFRAQPLMSTRAPGCGKTTLGGADRLVALPGVECGSKSNECAGSIVGRHTKVSILGVGSPAMARSLRTPTGGVRRWTRDSRR